MDNFKIFLAKDLFVVVGLIFIWVWWRQTKSKKIELVWATVIAAVLALIISRIAGKLYYDPRPFVTQHIKPLVSHAADNGFPSDHALLTATLGALAYVYAKKWGIAALVLAVLVSLGRVLVHVHSPIDVVTGFAIGLVSAWLGVWAAKKYLARPSQDKKQSKEV